MLHLHLHLHHLTLAAVQKKNVRKQNARMATTTIYPATAKPVHEGEKQFFFQFKDM